jgi:hypothetical protein
MADSFSLHLPFECVNGNLVRPPSDVNTSAPSDVQEDSRSSERQIDCDPDDLENTQSGFSGDQDLESAYSCSDEEEANPLSESEVQELPYMIPYTEEDLKFKWIVLRKKRNMRTTKRSWKHRKNANFVHWNNNQCAMLEGLKSYYNIRKRLN